MAKTKKIKSVYFCMDQDGLTKGYQLSIDMDYEDGTGSGTRLAGPKYCGMGKRLKTVVIGKQELDTLEKYIKLAKKWHKQADTEESKLAQWRGLVKVGKGIVNFDDGVVIGAIVVFQAI